MYSGKSFPSATTLWLALAILASVWGCGASAGPKVDGNDDPGTAGSAASVQESSDGDSDANEESTPDSNSADETSSTAGGDDANVAATTESEDPQPNVSTQTKAVNAARPQSSQLISFDDLNIGMQVDARFRPQMLEYDGGRVKELFGRKIVVAGYMNPTDTLRGVTEFILLRNLECKFGPGGQADHLVHVLMDEGLTTEFTDKVVYVEGVLSLNPFPTDEPVTWSIYDVQATKVSTKAPPRSR